MINRLVRLSRVVSSRLPREFKTNCEMLVIIEGKGTGMDGWMKMKVASVASGYLS